MIVHLLALLAVVNIVIAITTFVLYGRARMKEKELQEKKFLKLHYISLFVLMLLGIVFMFFMIETET